jgi:hypothetical protein
MKPNLKETRTLFSAQNKTTSTAHNSVSEDGYINS